MKPVRLTYARRRFTAARDEAGVPHVTADSWRGALYGLGYMHALDRPTQMLFARAVASGRSAEWIADKPNLVETDRFFRRVGLYLHLKREVHELEDGPFGDMTAYCEGVNDGLQQSGRTLPMRAAGFRGHPWDQQAVMLIANLLNFGGLAVTQQQNERLLIELVQAGVDPARLREMFQPLLDDIDIDLLKQVRISNRLSDEALELITDLPRLAGSNAWAIAPSRSATGGALLASDPHLEINRLPAIWYEAVVRWGDEYLLGATLPGCPVFAVARTRKLAWGVTYLKGDTSDYFIEDVRPFETGWQFRRGDGWREFDVRREVIHRKGGPAEEVIVYHNALGTLDGDPAQDGPGYYLTTAWSGDTEGVGRSLVTWLKLPHCTAALEALDLVRECPQPTLCWVVADAAGHIGLQANGRFPLRREGVTGLTPVPAWDVENHWRGWVHTGLLPRIYDPPEGFLASANENINPPGGPMLVTMPVPSYRKRRITERLNQMPAMGIADMQALQYDVISLQARDLLEIFLPHLPPGPIKERLAAWDCNYAPASLEATLFSRLYRNVLLEVFGEDPNSGGLGWRRMLYLCTRAGYSSMMVTSIDRLLHRADSLWWQTRDKGELIRRAAEKLNQEKDQPWSVTNAFKFTNRFFEAQFVGRALGFHTGEFAMPGCHATPFQGHLLRAAKRETTFAPSYHFVADLGTQEAWTNLPGGPSESRFSKWYTSDIPRWRDGKYKRLAAE